MAELFEKSVIISLILFLLYRSSIGAITVGSIVMYVQAMQKGQATIKNFITALSGVYSHRLYITELFHFLDLKHQSGQKYNPNEAKTILQDSKPKSLTINNLDFSYPNQNHRVLKNINTTFSAGQVIAIIVANPSFLTSRIFCCKSFFRRDE